MKTRLFIIATFFLLLAACTGDAYTELQLVAARGEAEMAQSILEKGADVNETNRHGKTALMLAAGNGRIEVMKILLARNALIDSQDIDGMTGLMMAASSGQTEAVKLLDRQI